MDKLFLEKYFSKERFQRYVQHYPNDEHKAILLYEANIAISEALYTPLSILEVALRNKINGELCRKYQRPDWYSGWYLHPILRFAWPEINKTMQHLHEEGKSILPDKVIASLMFGFWTSLFNDRYERELWSSLRFIFSNMPKSTRQRRNVSGPLNEIRSILRNRIYHNEPIIFNIPKLNRQYQNILLLLEWMGTDLLFYNNKLDRFKNILEQIESDLSNSL